MRSSWAKTMILAASVAAAAAIPGCKGFWDATTDSGSSSSTSTNPASGIFYVLNQKDSQLAGFSFTAATTTPTAVTGGSVTIPAVPFSLAMAPGGGAVYVGTAVGIYLYTVDSSGALTIGNSGQPIVTDPAYAMAVSPSGNWLLEAASGAGVLSAVPIVADTGLVDSSRSLQSVALPATSVNGIAVSPSGGTASYAFVAMGTGGTAVVPFTAGNAKPLGTVGRIGVKNSPGGDNAVAVDPANALLYVGETAALSATQSGGLRVFTIGSGSSILEITGSPFATGGTGPSSILPLASTVYVANSAVSGKSAGNVTGFSVTSTSGSYSLAAINTVTTGKQTSALAEDNTGAYLLAVNYGGTPDLSTFTFDSTTTGQLDTGPTASTGTSPAGAWAVVAP